MKVILFGIACRSQAYLFSPVLHLEIFDLGSHDLTLDICIGSIH